MEKKRLGVYFGTFAPFHKGHQQQIYKCAALNDQVLLVVSGYTNDRGDKIGLPLSQRYQYLQEAFADEADINVAMLDETDLPPMPQGWDAWFTRLFGLLKKYQSQEITFYVGEPEYVTELGARFPQDTRTYKVEMADRQDIKISATEIRENPLLHWNEINPVFRRHFTKIIGIIGGRKSGKSTLVRRLARSFNNAPFAEKIEQAITSAGNQGIVFIDNTLSPDMDLVLLIPSDNDAALLKKIAEQGLTEKVVRLDDEETIRDMRAYLGRYYHAIDAISQYTGIQIDRLKY
ncbi:adenylyltransferase/cytidyltransferase family protein [Lactococcus formosensis]|nr:adenylyltransferase/cytidyltransferase family protein [Lactococcus formosensis]MDG6126810.1 adenylyltransferase/cytidyltransferase family protein [Lactococcus formosensis]MDG6133055.1 adenylyltransferase/cytidyltransferase family protein [Lactococcus formosensis]MDG6135160.1 adenylyltransferase/cytidyltransferase family protein [Lactococcus formosensis]MDG6141057.1 adenylyltransferase/cytidyltransferase family protein [Lactococcus formosensis]MDG6147946.1 adenylyltransferase/cytidyltransfer